MTTGVDAAGPTTPDTTRRSILVGVDRRGRSMSAVVWAVEEAERDGSALRLISAVRETSGREDPIGEHDAAALAHRLTKVEVEETSKVGDPVDLLLDAGSEVDLIVVGCRTTGPARRLLLGSTSRLLAAWSPVPVVIVPEPWVQPKPATSPIVVGVRPPESAPSHGAQPDEEVLDFAFARAWALGVPLHVVSSIDPASLARWSAPDVLQIREEHHTSLATRLAPWTHRFPDVEVVAGDFAQAPHQALLEASRGAQLTVLGRHHSRSLTGLLGSTVRGVLGKSTRPVAVVPSGRREALSHELTEHRKAEKPWGQLI